MNTANDVNDVNDMNDVNNARALLIEWAHVC